MKVLANKIEGYSKYGSFYLHKDLIFKVSVDFLVKQQPISWTHSLWMPFRLKILLTFLHNLFAKSFSRIIYIHRNRKQVIWNWKKSTDGSSSDAILKTCLLFSNPGINKFGIICESFEQWLNSMDLKSDTRINKNSLKSFSFDIFSF